MLDLSGATTGGPAAPRRLRDPARPPIVIREVAEETGIQVESASYHSSQPWPFPGTLMLGYHAQAASRSISLNDKELEDACWLSRKQISEGLATGRFQLPTDISISFRLIEDWYNRIDGASLRTLRNRYHKDW